MVFRPIYATPQYHLELFWSYERVADGSGYLIYEIALNYIMFIPIGGLVPVVLDLFGVFKRHRFCWVILIAFLSSSAIECSQLLLRRGLFEFDDIIGNVAGAGIGYGMYKVTDIIRRRLFRSI